MRTDHPLRRYRHKNKISLEDLASALGVSTAMLSRIENRKQPANWDLVVQLKALSKGKLTADDFLPEAR